MIEMLIGLAAVAQERPVEPGHPCAPRINLTAGGPPPAEFYVQRYRNPGQAYLTLSVHDCRGGDGRRVERDARVAEAAGAREWVTTDQCPALDGWIAAGGRIAIPAPADRQPLDKAVAGVSLWYSLSGVTLTGGGRPARFEVEARQAADAPPNALGGWMEEGVVLFQACRDAGHGGDQWLPLRRGGR